MAKSLKVQPGDTISMEVFAKYTQPNGRSRASDVAGFIAAAFTNSFGITTGVDGKTNESYDFFRELFAAGPIFNSNDDGVPNAHLNYLLFDDDYVLQDAGFQRISTAAKETGSNSPHEKLNLQAIAQKAGYIYIYLSNESSKLSEVYFDDMTITQTLSPIISAEDYYPFGLTFNQQTREGTQGQRYLYNDGAEREDALDLNVDFTKYRNYDPVIGRWWQIDSYEKHHESPYAWVTNNPIRFNDPLGLDTLSSDSPDFIWDNVKSGDVVDDAVVLDDVVVEDDKEQESKLLDDKYEYDGNPKIVPYDVSNIPAILPLALWDGPELGPADVFVGGLIALILMEAIMPRDWIIIPIHNPDAINYYTPPPRRLPGFPGAIKVPGKGRARWKSPDGDILEWDSQHGDVEVYNKRGKHKGSANPDTGKMTKDPVPGRTIDP